MITLEQALESALKNLTELDVYPLRMPDWQQEGCTYQRIADPEMDTGLVRTRLIAGRFQITLYRIEEYPSLLALDTKIWDAWRTIRHGEIAGYPVQYVARGPLLQDCETLTSGRMRYRLIRDYFIYFHEDST